MTDHARKTNKEMRTHMFSKAATAVMRAWSVVSFIRR